MMHTPAHKTASAAPAQTLAPYIAQVQAEEQPPVTGGHCPPVHEDAAITEGLTPKESWWAGAAAGLGLRPDSSRTTIAAALAVRRGLMSADHVLEVLAERYHARAEAFDRTVCTGFEIRGVIMPATTDQMVAINRHALHLLDELALEAVAHGLTRYQLRQAISRHHTRCAPPATPAAAGEAPAKESRPAKPESLLHDIRLQMNHLRKVEDGTATLGYVSHKYTATLLEQAVEEIEKAHKA